MSGETKWAPGPWVADGFFVSSNSGGAVAHDIVSACGTVGRPDSETEANAQLIAAAPDLYEALADLVHQVDRPRAPSWLSLDDAFAALDKARGESQ